LSSPVSCYPGYYCPKNGLISGILCEPGNYCPNYGMSSGIICTIGNYCQNPGLQVPSKCPATTYNNETGATSLNQCLMCPIGFICNLEGSATPSLCPPGGYCPNTGMPNNQPCPAGTYNSLFGSISINDCVICPAGNLCLQGTINPQNCTKGSYCPEGTQIAKACPTGTYSDKYNLKDYTECTNCPSGTYNQEVGQTTITSCYICLNGTYCPDGSQNPSPCQSNYYCPTPSQEIACPAGTYYSGIKAKSVDTCQECSPGSYCPGEGKGAILCSLGTYTDLSGSKICKTCPDGSWCEVGSSRPNECPQNTIPGQSSGGCIPCPQNEFTEGPGQSVCLTCPSSKFSFDGWWCMNSYERLIFVVLWAGSIISCTVTIYKLKKFIKERISKLKEAGLTVTLKRLIFINTVLKNDIEMVKEESEDYSTPMIINPSSKMKRYEEIIINMQKDIEYLKNKK